MEMSAAARIASERHPKLTFACRAGLTDVCARRGRGCAQKGAVQTRLDGRLHVCLVNGLMVCQTTMGWRAHQSDMCIHNKRSLSVWDHQNLSDLDLLHNRVVEPPAVQAAVPSLQVAESSMAGTYALHWIAE